MMLSTSFIVARQPDKSIQEGISRNSVNSPIIINYEHENTGDCIARGRETLERKAGQTERACTKTRDISQNGQTKESRFKKLARSISMNKKESTNNQMRGKIQGNPGRSLSQTRYPQQMVSEAAWDRHNQNTNNESVRNLSIRANAEGATKISYKYNLSSYGTIGGDASSIFAIQNRPLPDPEPGEGGKKKAENSLYESINRFTSIDRLSKEMTNFQKPQMSCARNGISTPYGTRSRIPVYKPEQSSKIRMGQRAATQMEISRAIGNPPSLGYSLHDTEENIIKKGSIWVQQDKMFSRWKERFIILTYGYLQIFKKGVTKFSDMGAFISKIKLSSIDFIALEDRRGYLTLVLTTSIPQEGKLMLRKTEGLKDWHESLVSCCHNEGQRKSSLPTKNFRNRKQFSESCGFENRISTMNISENTFEDSPSSAFRRQYKTINNLKRAENLYSDSREYSGISTYALSVA